MGASCAVLDNQLYEGMGIDGYCNHSFATVHTGLVFGHVVLLILLTLSEFSQVNCPILLHFASQSRLVT